MCVDVVLLGFSQLRYSYLGALIVVCCVVLYGNVYGVLLCCAVLYRVVSCSAQTARPGTKGYKSITFIETSAVKHPQRQTIGCKFK